MEAKMRDVPIEFSKVKWDEVVKATARDLEIQVVVTAKLVKLGKVPSSALYAPFFGTMLTLALMFPSEN
jgi:hypothetical protein